MRNILILAIFLLGGCGGSFYYTFKIEPINKNSLSLIKDYIALEEMEIPDYLKQNHIAIMEKNRVTFLSAKWSEPVEQLLKKETISFFMKEKSIGVIEYPWQGDIKAKDVIKITIEDFIYKNGNVVLEGYYFLKKNGKIYKKLFFYKEKCDKNAENIVKTMQKLYKKLLTDIKANL